MKKVLSFLGLLAGGTIIGWGGAKLFLGERNPDEAPFLPDGYGIWLLLALPLLYLVVVGIHELGHVALGRLQGFQFYGLTIGPFAWKPDANGKIRFHWNTSLNLAGGIAIMLPNGSDRLRQRFMWFAAGGPLASLLLAALGFGLSLLLQPTTFVYFLALTICLFSLAIFVATILPFRAGGLASDGMRILTFVRNGPTAAADLAGLRAMAHLRAGLPHEELPADEFAAVSANEKIPAQQRVTMDYYRYLHALAAGNSEAAAALLQGVMNRLEVYPPGTHGSFYLEQALFEAQYRKNLTAAEAAFANYTESPFVEALSVHLAAAAIAVLKDDQETLAPLLPMIETALPGSMDQSRIPLIKDWLKQWNVQLSTS